MQIAESALNMATSSDEEFHSAAEEENTVSDKGQERTSQEKEDERLDTEFERVDLKSNEADNDHTSQSTKPDDDEGKTASGDSQSEAEAKVSGLDNRYVSEEHAPEKDGAVELTEEQIKVCKATKLPDIDIYHQIKLQENYCSVLFCRS